MKKEIIVILAIATLFISWPTNAQEGTKLGIYYIGFLPLDSTQAPLLFEEPHFIHYGGSDIIVSNFDKTQKAIVVDKLRELIKNFTGKYPPSEEWKDANPIVFNLDGSYFDGEKGQLYVFRLYPSFLIIEYTPGDYIDNRTYRNILSEFHSAIRGVNSKILEKLGIKIPHQRYKIIIHCWSCSTDIRDINIESYKTFFGMNTHTKPAADPFNFLLFGTPVWMDKEHDTTVVSFNPGDRLFPALELIEVVIPYSNEKIGQLSKEIDNSREKLKNVSGRLTDSDSTKTTDKLITELRNIEGTSSHYNEKLKWFRNLKTIELKFLSENEVYLQIKNIKNKTYEEIIKSHVDILDNEIIFLDRELDFWNSHYWSLIDFANARLGYQQQNELFWRNVWILIGVVVLVDIVIRAFDDEIKFKVRKTYISARYYVTKIIEFIKTKVNP